MQTKSSRRTLGAIFNLEDRLIGTFNRIKYGITLKSNPDLLAELRELATLFRVELDRDGFLTPEREQDLDGVESELQAATAAEECGNSAEVWAALIRAHGRINRAGLDFMTKDWLPAFVD